jgi:elongation factor Ts
MSDISAKDVAQLRQDTGAGVMDAKKALLDAKGDTKKAIELLKEKGLSKAAKKADRETAEGMVHAYIHGGGQIGVLVELLCETDFVARGDDFGQLAQDVAMQVAAGNPKDSKELMSQPFIKDESQTIEQLLTAAIAKHGENIQVKRFVRYELGNE